MELPSPLSNKVIFSFICAYMCVMNVVTMETKRQNWIFWADWLGCCKANLSLLTEQEVLLTARQSFQFQPLSVLWNLAYNSRVSWSKEYHQTDALPEGTIAPGILILPWDQVQGSFLMRRQSAESPTLQASAKSGWLNYSGNTGGIDPRLAEHPTLNRD